MHKHSFSSGANLLRSRCLSAALRQVVSAALRPVVSSVLCASLALATPALASQQFGPAFDTTASIAVSEILRQPAAYVGKTVTVQGTVSEVCQKKGCWMQFKTDVAAPVFRLKVRDGDMVFPLSARGKTAYATGTLSVREMDLAETQDYLAHRAEEQGEAFDASKVKPLTIYQLAPVAVQIK